MLRKATKKVHCMQMFLEKLHKHTARQILYNRINGG